MGRQYCGAILRHSLLVFLTANRQHGGQRDEPLANALHPAKPAVRRQLLGGRSQSGLAHSVRPAAEPA